MKFLVDAQHAERLARLLAHAGHVAGHHAAVHWSALTDRHRTPDVEIARLADVEDRVVSM